MKPVPRPPRKPKESGAPQTPVPAPTSPNVVAYLPNYPHTHDELMAYMMANAMMKAIPPNMNPSQTFTHDQLSMRNISGLPEPLPIQEVKGVKVEKEKADEDDVFEASAILSNLSAPDLKQSRTVAAPNANNNPMRGPFIPRPASESDAQQLQHQLAMNYAEQYMQAQARAAAGFCVPNMNMNMNINIDPRAMAEVYGSSSSSAYFPMVQQYLAYTAALKGVESGNNGGQASAGRAAPVTAHGHDVSVALGMMNVLLPMASYPPTVTPSGEDPVDDSRPRKQQKLVE